MNREIELRLTELSKVPYKYPSKKKDYLFTPKSESDFNRSLSESDIVNFLDRLQSDDTDKLFENYPIELNSNLLTLKDKIGREAYIYDNIMSLLNPLKVYKSQFEKYGENNKEQFTNLEKVVYTLVINAMILSQDIEYQCRVFSLDFPALLEKAYFNIESYNFLQDWGKRVAKKNGSFDELFEKPEDLERCLSALREVKPAIIDKDNNYLLGDRKKSVFAILRDVLTGKIKHVNDKDFGELLTKKIKGLSVSDKTLSQPKREFIPNLPQATPRLNKRLNIFHNFLLEDTEDKLIKNNISLHSKRK